VSYDTVKRQSTGGSNSLDERFKYALFKALRQEHSSKQSKLY